MHIVKIINGGVETIVHGDFAHLAECKVAIEKNAIPSMTFDIYPGNPGYGLLSEFATLVECIDRQTGGTVFEGRVISAPASMGSDGAVKKSVTCEGLAGYLCDSVQPYTEERNWTGDEQRTGLQEFVDYVLANHNARMPAEKRIFRGVVDLPTFKTVENVTKGTNFERTYDIVADKLVGSFGGEWRVRRGSDGLLCLDYRERLGERSDVTIELGRNIESASRELKPDQLITRLYPRGCKLKATEVDEDGTEREVETDERLGIGSVNGGVEYIDDDDAVKLYGIVEGTNEWDDVTDPAHLKDKAQRWLAENNQLPVSTTIDGVDLSYLGIEPGRIEAFGWYPCRNDLIGLDDVLEVVKQVIDVSEPASSTWEFGDAAARQSGAISSLKKAGDALEVVKSQVKTSVVNLKSVVVYTKAAIEVSESAITSTVGKRIEQTSAELNGNIATASGSLSDKIDEVNDDLSGRIDGVSGTVTTVTEQVSTLTQTAESITASVKQLKSDQESMQSTIEAMPDSIKLEVTQGYTDYVAGQLKPVNESISTLQVTASGLTSSVEQLEAGYGVCTTGGAVAAKEASIQNFASLHRGATVCVKFSYANAVASPTLNVSDTGAKPITLNGATLAKDYWWAAGDVMTLVYNGTSWAISDAGAKSKIRQLANSISLEVSGKLGGTASIVMSVDGSKTEQSIDMSGVREAFKNDTSAISISAGTVTFNSNTFVVNSTYFKVTSAGVITATSGTIGGFTIGASSIRYQKAALADAAYGVYIGTDGISVGSGTAYTALAGGYLRGGNADSITGYVGFNNYWSDTGKYGARLAGRGCIALLTDGAFGIGAYYQYGTSATITVGQSKTITFGTSLELEFTYSHLYNVQCTDGKYYPDVSYISGYSWKMPRSSIAFTKGLMTTS